MVYFLGNATPLTINARKIQFRIIQERNLQKEKNMQKAGSAVAIFGNVLIAISLFGKIGELIVPAVVIGCAGVIIVFISSFRY